MLPLSPYISSKKIQKVQDTVIHLKATVDEEPMMDHTRK